MTRIRRFRPSLLGPILTLWIGMGIGFGESADGFDQPWGTAQSLDATATDVTGLVRADLNRDGADDLVSFGPDGLVWLDGASSPASISGAVTDLQAVAVVDLDQDGDPDLVGGSASLGLIWWQNTAGDASAWSQTTVAGSLDVRGLAAADLDADGDPDLVAALDGSVEWWRNDGGAASWTRLAIDAAYADATAVAVTDLDHDGDLDVIATAAGTADLVTWWRHDGASWTELTLDSGRSDPGALAVDDFDRDGDTDVAAVDAAGLHVWRSDGSPGDGGWSLVSAAVSGLDRLDSLDLDGDGDPDLISSAGTSVLWWESETGTFTARTGPSTGAARGAVALHLDGDGLWDLAAADHSGDTVLGWSNLSTDRSTLFREQELDGAYDGARSVHAADLDGDGDLDVVGAAYHQGEITWWRNDGGDPVAWTRFVVDSGLPYAFAVRAVDLDADGDLDILGSISRLDFQTGTNKLYWWRNDALSWTRMSVASPFGASDVWPVDMDMDGDVDLLSAAAGSDEIAWYANNGSAGGWAVTVINTVFGRVHSAVAADLDGDGDPDVAAAADTGDEIAWWENTAGDGSAWTQHTVQSSWDGAYDVWVGDIDGDGDLDLIGASEFDDRISWWANTDGAGTFGSENTLGDPFMSAEGFFNQAYSVETAGMEGNGTLDIVGAAFKDGGPGQPEAGMIAWWSNEAGDGSTWQKHEVTRTYDGASTVHVADVTGDGLPDILSTARGLPVFPRAAKAGSGGDRLTLWSNDGGQAALITTSTAPADPASSSSYAVLAIEAVHRGAAGQADLELASLGFTFTDTDDAPLSSIQAEALLDRLRLFRDDTVSGTPGTFDLVADTLVTTVETLSLDGTGLLDMPLADGGSDVAVGPGESALFFVVMDTTAAYESQPLAGFRITHRQTESRVENRDADTELRLEYGADVDTGAMAIGDLVDLQVSLGATPDPVTAGQSITFTATVQNAGPSTAEAVVLTWALPSGISAPTTSGCTEDPAGTATCNIGDLLASASTMVTLTATVDEATSGTLEAAVSATSAGGEAGDGGLHAVDGAGALDSDHQRRSRTGQCRRFRHLAGIPRKPVLEL